MSRRGVIAGLIFVVLAGAINAPAVAGTWSDLWSTHEQQGQELLDSNQPGKAAALFNDPKRRGYAQLQAGQYDKAAELLKPLKDADSQYNRGNALAHTGKLRDALTAYDAALASSPGNKDVLRNRELVEKALQAQNRQQGNGNGPSGQNGKGQQGQSNGGGQGSNGAGEKQAGQQGQQPDGGNQGQSGSQSQAAQNQQGQPNSGSQGQSGQQNQSGNQDQSGSQRQANAQNQQNQQANGGNQAQPGQQNQSGNQAQPGGPGQANAQSQPAPQRNDGSQPQPGQQPSGASQAQTAQQAQAAQQAQLGGTGTQRADANTPDSPLVKGSAAADSHQSQSRSEQALALDQWLRGIPEDSSELLRRKFLIEHMMKQQGYQP